MDDLAGWSVDLPGTNPGPRILDAGGAIALVLKPAGMTVFPSRKEPGAPSVLGFVMDALPSAADHPWPEGFEGGILHRLDTPTSGLLCVATSLEALRQARARFVSHTLEKRYLLVAPAGGEPVDVGREIAHHPRDARRMVARRGPRTDHRGKWYPARTRFIPLAPVGDGLALWEARMATGVMHQIRVHAAYAGIPLVGDALYGGLPGPGPAPRAGFWLHHAAIHGLMDEAPRAPLPAAWRVWLAGGRGIPG